MKKFYLSFLFLLGLSVSGLSAQVVEKVLDILGKDSLPASAAAVTADSDSVSLAAVRQELAAAKLNEANLRMEIEQIKLAAYAADSLKLAGQKQRIDSLRQEVTGMPVVVEGVPQRQAARPFALPNRQLCVRPRQFHSLG